MYIWYTSYLQRSRIEDEMRRSSPDGPPLPENGDSTLCRHTTALQRFYYASHQIAIAYDVHICEAGVPDVDTSYGACPRHEGERLAAYHPSFHVPGKNHTVVITDCRFGEENLARAWMADRIRQLILSRRCQRLPPARYRRRC